jgi:AraC-like DNA-binding protein
MNGSDQVARFEVSSQDEAETEEYLRQMYVDCRVEMLTVGDGTRFAAAGARAAQIGAGRIRSTLDYRGETAPFDNYLFFGLDNGQIRIRNGAEETMLLAGDQAFYPLGVPFVVDMFDMAAKTLQLPAARIETTAEQTAGIRGSDLRFTSTAPVSATMARQWATLIDLVAAALLPQDGVVSPLMIEELTRTTAITALHTFPSTALTVAYQPSPAWVTPASVRRAAAFLHAHADQPITIDQIAAAAGVTARALQYAFRRHYDATPTQYLRRIRLERAEQDLRARRGTIAEIARRWGWASASQFAVAYRRRFGILPSHTQRG